MNETLLTKIVGLALILISVAFAADDPFFRIKEGGKWGFINRSGDVVIKPQYDECYYQFSEGLAAVEVSGKWGYINQENRMVIPPTFSSARQFKNGIASVRLGSLEIGKGKNAFIDSSGKLILGPWDRWTSHDFREGLIQDRVDEKWHECPVVTKTNSIG